MSSDVKSPHQKHFTELFVLNSDQEWHVFQLSSFDGEVVLASDTNYITGNGTEGLIAGPSAFVTNYDINSQLSCGSYPCRQVAAPTGGTYSTGNLFVLQWGTSSSNLARQKAAFGATAQINTFADRGVLLMAK